MAHAPITQALTVAVPVTVRLRDRDAVGYATLPYAAEGRAAGYRHVAYGETSGQAVANLRDWIVGTRVPEKVAGAEERKITLQWVLDTAEAIECMSYDGCCGCIDALIEAVKTSLAVQTP